MLAITKEKLSKKDFMKVKVLEPVSTQDIIMPDKDFDVITAIQAHHYLDRDSRKVATENCFRILKDHGIYVTFENIRPLSEKARRYS